MGKNAKFLYLSNGKFSEIFKIEIFLSLNLFLYELWSFKHQNFFWKFTLKAECSKIGTIRDFWLYLPFFVVLQENIRFVLKTSLTKLSNEYKNIIIPQWNDWENWVWIRAADFIDVACTFTRTSGQYAPIVYCVFLRSIVTHVTPSKMSSCVS